MKASRTKNFLLFLGLLLALPCMSARAQDQPPGSSQQPAPPDSGAPPQGEEDVPTVLQTPQNDRTPVSGVEDYRLDGLNLGRNFLLGTIKFTEVYDTNTNSSKSSSKSLNDSISTLHGNLSLQWLSPKTALDLDYNTGVLFYSKGTFSTSMVQQLNVTEKLYIHRWTVLFGNDFAYLPQSPVGLGGLGVGSVGNGGNGGIPGLGGGLTNYNPFYVPGQSIQSVGNRVSNAVVGQGQYTIGPRSSLNFSGTYSLVHFFDSGFLNSRSIGLRFGYDYLMNARNTITFALSSSDFGYSTGISSFSNHSATAAYRRTLTGRLSVIIQGGPQISHFSSPLTGSSNRYSWMLRSVVRYVKTRNDLNLIYLHHITEGSGLLVGASSDALLAQVGRTLTRRWSGSLIADFSHNSSLRQTTGATLGRHFTTWRGGIEMQRTLGSRTSIQFRYTASRQTANVSICALNIPCGSIALRQQIGMGINWASRPYSID